MDENTDVTREESVFSWDKFTSRNHKTLFFNTLTGNSKLVLSSPPAENDI